MRKLKKETTASETMSTLSMLTVCIFASATVLLTADTTEHINKLQSQLNEEKQTIQTLSDEIHLAEERYFESVQKLEGEARRSSTTYEYTIEMLESDFDESVSQIPISYISNLPNCDTNTYRCMDYRTLTNHRSDQWKLQEQCYTDSETGIRIYTANGERYLCVALGSAYTQTIGDAFYVELENGYSFNVINGDFKNPIDKPDPTFYGHPDVNYDGEDTISVIEFIYDWEAAPKCVIMAGTMSALDMFGGLYGNGGNIKSIKYLGRIWE